MGLVDGLMNIDGGLNYVLQIVRKISNSKWLLWVLLFIVVSNTFSQKSLGGECEVNGFDDYFKTPCDISGTYSTPSSDFLGITSIGSDLTMERIDTSISIKDFGTPDFPILQTRILMTYKGTLRVPIVRIDSSRPFGDRTVAFSRIKYFIKGAIEWRSDVRGGTGRIEGGAWTPENPPGVDRTRVAGRAESIIFEATVDEDTLPCCERVGLLSRRMVFIVNKVDDTLQTDLGLGRGMSFSISRSNGSTLRSCETSGSCEEDPDISWVVPFSTIFDLGSVQPLLNFNIPTGTIKVRLTSTEPVETLTGDDIQKATIQLFTQDGFLKGQKADETDEEFRERLAASRTLVDQCVECDLNGKDGRYSFTDVPLLESVSTSGSKVLRPAYYTVEITDPQSEELLSSVGEETITLFFTNDTVRNMRPDTEEPFEEKEIGLTPLDAIAKKEKLVVDLSKIGPNHYSPIEEKVQQFLEKVKDEQKPEQLEAVRRGILAERLVLSSAKFAEPLIKTMLGGFESLLKDLIDELDFGKGKKLTKAKKKQKKLQDSLDAEKLKSKGWKLSDDSDAVTNIKNEMRELVEGDDNLLISFLGKIGKLASKGVFTVVNKALLLAKMEKSAAQDVATFMETSINTVFSTMITQNAGGLRKTIVKQLIHKLLKDQEKTLLDGPGVTSYTFFTEDSLEETLNSMKAWNTDNKEAFLLNRIKFNKIDSDMGEAVLVVAGGITAFSTEIADALGGFGGDVVDAIGDFGGPAGKFLALAAKVLKYTSNATTFGVPFITIYGVLGGPDTEVTIPVPLPILSSIPGLGLTFQLGLVEKATAAAFGKGEPDGAFRITAPLQIAENTVAANPNLISALEKAQTDINNVIDDLVTSLREDRIADAISFSASIEPENDSFIKASARLERCVSHINATSQDSLLTSEKVIDLTLKNVGVTMISSELTQLISDMFYKVLLLDYTGPSDPFYIAERNLVISKIESFRRTAGSLASDATSVFNETKDSVTLPAVVVDNIMLSSDAKGGKTITMSPEDFTLIAHVKNISTMAVSGLSAMLTVTSTENSIVVSTPLEMTVGSGSLGADDGANGTGGDEADVVWRFNYNGDPSKVASILFSVDLLENGNPPVTFRAFSEANTLEPDITLTDKDLDGMPDEWESSNGLDDTIDDSEDDKDNDGLSNQRELYLGTDPQNPDTDGDGLTDGEESTGGNDGYVTDPLNADTDDDGVSDGSDGQPVDGGTSEMGEMPDEPVVAIDINSVFLSKGVRVVSVKVTNSGTGILRWTATSDNEAIATVSPSAPDQRNGDGTILISAAANFDLDNVGILETTVHVIDLSGATHDIQSIAVSFGTGTNDPTGSAGQTGPGGGLCGAMGMITLPMTFLTMLGMRRIRPRRRLQKHGQLSSDS